MKIIEVKPTDDLQSKITEATQNGGGILNLDPTTPYLLHDDLYFEDNVTINGNGGTIDFQGGNFGIKAIGYDSYTTGTIAINFDSNEVVGTGTTWTELMQGQYMLIGDFWYLISSVVDTTHITLDTNYIGLNTTGATYVIATIIYNIGLKNINIQNSAGSLIEFAYVDSFNIESVYLYNADTGINGYDSNNIYYIDGFVDNCTNGLIFNNIPSCTYSDLTMTNSNGLSFTKISNASIGVMSLINITGVGISFTNCYNIGVFEISITKCSSHGIELVSGNNDLYLYGLNINSCGGDGLKLTATSTRIEISGNNFINNTGYGINIANANCSKVILVANNTATNTAGALADSGTSTLKSTTVNNFS